MPVCGQLSKKGSLWIIHALMRGWELSWGEDVIRHDPQGFRHVYLVRFLITGSWCVMVHSAYLYVF